MICAAKPYKAVIILSHTVISTTTHV